MRTLSVCLILLVSCTKPCLDKDTLSDLAQASVAERLKSPSTAVFTETTLRTTADGTKQMIEGAVDSQNGFGAMIRGEYYVTFTCDGGKPAIATASMEGEMWGPEWESQRDSIEAAFEVEVQEALDAALEKAEAK
jgi:hypothetical protein